MEMGAADLLSQPVQEMAWRSSGAALGQLRDGLYVDGHHPLSVRAWGLHVSTAHRSFFALSVGSCGSRPDLQVGWVQGDIWV